jgi:hypothetical protein
MLLLLFIYPSTGFSQTKKLVTLGSSTTAGNGTTTIDSCWVSRLRKYYECFLNQSNVVYNLGKPGYDNYRAMPTGYLPPILRPFPDTTSNLSKACLILNETVGPVNGVVIVNFPTNGFDIYSIPEILTSLQVIYDSITMMGHRCFITTTQPRTDGNFNKAEIKKKLAVIKDSIIYRCGNENTINFWDGLFNPSDSSILLAYSSGDKIHFNDKGHRILFERVLAKNIFNLPVWYCKETGYLNNLTSWGSNKDGSGNNPTSFTNNFAKYHIVNNPQPTINANWLINGINVQVIVGDSIKPVNFKLPASLKVSVSSPIKNTCF